VRRAARAFSIAVFVLVVVASGASLVYDAATQGRVKDATALYRGPFVRIDDTVLAYRRWGDRGSPIVLLSGFAEPSWVWHRVGGALGRAHRVFALDLPPFGYSQRRGPYTLAHWSELVLDFARQMHLPRPILVGHSLGAAVAVRTALTDSAATSGVVLVDGDALPGGGPGWFAHLLLPPWYTALFRFATSSDWLVRRVVRNAWPGSPPLTHRLLEEFERPFRVEGTDSAFRALLGNGIQGVSTNDLRHLRVRRLVVWGSRDTVDSVAAGRRTAALLHARFLLLPGAGHLSMLGAPERLVRTIDAFAPRRASRLDDAGVDVLRVASERERRLPERRGRRLRRILHQTRRLLEIGVRVVVGLDRLQHDRRLPHETARLGAPLRQQQRSSVLEHAS
jgi:pimeloyl-ACP methyl ester carboxylesterase